eukprot:c27012_g1_i2 orf=142-3336(+)
MENPEMPCRNVRNICILAHVDHGKTTLADHLIAGGGAGILHPKQAGKLRYLDYRDDEQQRAITMKSSSIALHYKGHLVNLIDSPGHVDFCSEVSTAARMSDGALVLVDVCEGVHIQTHAVLRQAWIERVTPCLVLNKVDRLIIELKLSPLEAYTRLRNIILEVNNIINIFRSEKYISDVDSILERQLSTSVNGGEDDIEEEDEGDAFAPERGNVVFASALDGWGFRIEQFAALYAAKLGASQTVLRKALWGEHYYVPKTKKIVGKKAVGGKGRPMFVQFVLEPIWHVYDVAEQGSHGQEMLSKIISSMNLTIPPRDLQLKDWKIVLQSVMSRWLPLSDTVFSMVIDSFPNPALAQTYRVEHLFSEFCAPAEMSNGVATQIGVAKDAVKTCDRGTAAPCIVFVSKMFAVPFDVLPRCGPNGELLQILAEDLSGGDSDVKNQDCFLAFARVFSGVLRDGQKLFILSPFHNPAKTELNRKDVHEATVLGLYMMMGRGLEPKATVSAGNLVAIRGLAKHILKTATLSSTPYCLPFTGMTYQASPIMRVAIEPSDPADIGALTHGLRLLNRADPFVEVSISGTGEHVIAAAGEVHLERCIKDLRERFAGVELEISPPLVAFKETIEIEGMTPIEASRDGQARAEFVEKTTPNGRCTVRVHAIRLPPPLTEVLDKNATLLQCIIENKTVNISAKCRRQVRNDSIQEQADLEDTVTVLRNHLLAAATRNCATGSEKKKDEGDANAWLGRLQRIWALGPRRVGSNLLILPDSNIGFRVGGNSERLGESSEARALHVDVALVKGSAHVSEKLGLLKPPTEDAQLKALENLSDGSLSSLAMEAEALENSVISGFQLATASGPLCEEPMWGLAFTVEAWISARSRGVLDDNNVLGDDDGDGVYGMEQYGPFSGQVMTVVKDACRLAMLSKCPRLVEAMYFCEVTTPPEHLGQMYAVLGRRRARVLKEEMREGSAMFTVHAYMPVAESFGFTDELRRKTSGAASPQLILSHWEALMQDPFFVPKTVEELEEYGDGSSVPQNTARKLIDAVRRRKGLPVEEKVVQHATKQRTLARKV